MTWMSVLAFIFPPRSLPRPASGRRCAACLAPALWLSLSLLLAWPTGMASAEEPVDFSRDVLPLLSSRCFLCHGPDASSREADLRFDQRDVAVADRYGRPAIAPGHPEKSQLIARITESDADLRMPPAETGEPLTKEQIELLRNWIAGGAAYTEHWAFVPAVRPAPPAVDDAVQSPIDRFVLQRLGAAGLRAAPRAAREVLIRRATLDLTGLPPTPAEVDAFVNDDSPDAFAQLVDRLLESPHYGERWGRHWLDVARYADSGGFETDIFNGHAWRYRDYVIRSFNEDKPFDRFVREQVAGDELYPGQIEPLIATSFFTTGPVLQEAGMVPGKLEYDQLTDAADTTGAAFLGMTIGCARCHDHKYDPISQQEYFGLQAIFAASDHYDLKADGATVVRGRAAIKNTLAEFELEQLKQRARNEADPDARVEQLRRIGDFYLGSSGNNRARRGNRPMRTTAELAAALQAYREIVARHDEEGIDVSDSILAERQKELSEALIGVGRIAIQLEPRGSRARRAFRELEIDTEINEFLLEFGEQTADAAPPAVASNDDAARPAREDSRPNTPAEPDPSPMPQATADPRLAAGEKGLEGESAVPLRVLRHRDEPIEVRLLARGELDFPGNVVGPSFPAKLSAGMAWSDVPANRRRAALAEWIASPQHPLTARVMANRIWQWHFGAGLVRTPNDFGTRGERPTHPELLDWLAVEFMENGWSIKHLHRVIMLSSAYQMSSEVDAAALEADPENRLLTRYQPRRLEAEMIWDSLRAVSGTLNPKLYGLPVAPPLDSQEQIGNFRKWPTSPPEEFNRRAVYLLVRRSFRFPMFGAFDLPDNISSCGQRDVTTIPNQALTLLNNASVAEQAAAFARRLLDESGGTLSDIPSLAWRYAFGRAIRDDERAMALQFLEARINAAQANNPGGQVAVADHVDAQRDDSAPVDTPELALQRAVSELCLSLFNTNEFLYLP